MKKIFTQNLPKITKLKAKIFDPNTRNSKKIELPILEVPELNDIIIKSAIAEKLKTRIRVVSQDDENLMLSIKH